MIDIICLAVVGVITWFVATEGIWGAVQVFLCTLLAGLVAMNFFEPLAGQLRAVVPDKYCDIVALLGLFTGLTFALRMGTEYLSPSYIQVFLMLDTAGRWVVGAATGYLTMAFLLTAVHTAPLPREFLGFQAERANFFGSFPDRQWLGFVQYVSAKAAREFWCETKLAIKNSSWRGIHSTVGTRRSGTRRILTPLRIHPEG